MSTDAKPHAGPIQIGRTYLDIWGHQHHIHGFAKVGGRESTDIVWSLSEHFYIRTGKSVSAGKDLVVLPPEEEAQWWRERIALIEGANSPDKLALIKDQLNAMRERAGMTPLA